MSAACSSSSDENWNEAAVPPPAPPPPASLLLDISSRGDVYRSATRDKWSLSAAELRPAAAAADPRSAARDGNVTYIQKYEITVRVGGTVVKPLILRCRGGKENLVHVAIKYIKNSIFLSCWQRNIPHIIIGDWFWFAAMDCTSRQRVTYPQTHLQ